MLVFDALEGRCNRHHCIQQRWVPGGTYWVTNVYNAHFTIFFFLNILWSQNSTSLDYFILFCSRSIWSVFFWGRLAKFISVHLEAKINIHVFWRAEMLECSWKVAQGSCQSYWLTTKRWVMLQQACAAQQGCVMEAFGLTWSVGDEF